MKAATPEAKAGYAARELRLGKPRETVRTKRVRHTLRTATERERDASGEQMSEPTTVVKPVSVTYDQIPMLVPPFTDQFGTLEDKILASELLRLTKELRVLLSQLSLYIAMSRSQEFGAACSATDAKEGRAIILGSLLRGAEWILKNFERYFVRKQMALSKR